MFTLFVVISLDPCMKLASVIYTSTLTKNLHVLGNKSVRNNYCELKSKRRLLFI